MTQEIGFIEPFEKYELIDFDEFPIGSILELLQYHSCDTAAKFQVVISKVPRLNIKSHYLNSKLNFQVYYVHDKNEKVVAEWKPTRCW